MKWFEVWLCDYQPEPFTVRADSHEEAGEKTIKWAIQRYPGMFEFNPDIGKYTMKGRFQIVIDEIGAWN